jgi:hypothetical protein
MELRDGRERMQERRPDVKLVLFVLLLIVCWPAALALLILYPIVWLILLPFRLIGLTVTGVFDLLRAIFELPLKLVRAI